MNGRCVSQWVPSPRYLTALLAAAIIASAAPAAQPAAKDGGATPRPPPAAPLSQRGALYYARLYGVDQLRVHSTSSGQSVEFRYHVVDPSKAAQLNDKKASPVLTDLRTGSKFAVPQVENVGFLRQTATPEAGKEYWMVFQNAGRVVKPGDRVEIVIGRVRLSGLVVE
jgi:hypothetical protein